MEGKRKIGFIKDAHGLLEPTPAELEEVLVRYDREKMISSILSSSYLDGTIDKFVGIRR